ncbi:hypothetical protein AB4114_35765, partial [Paenibacillus sp. 2RAB27]|uniref:hypothetical protein n=1 Tax=Paenibacillus sp. 2RAB27 TaxID=3232991 RepID=UPI003F96CD7F
SWTLNNTVMTITLGGTGIDVKKGDTLNVAAGALKNIGNEGSIVALSPVIGGTFGIGAVPAIGSIQATNDLGLGGANAGDKVTIAFTAVTNIPSTLSILSSITLSSGHTFGTGATAAWSLDGASLIITLGTNATVTVGDTVTIGTGAGIKDYSGESATISGEGTISGTFGEIVQPTLSNVYATNGDGTAAVAEGDTLEFVFNTPVDHSTFDISTITVKDSTGTVTRINPFGVTQSVYWADPIGGYDTRLQIVLGANPTIQITDVVSIAASNGIKDVTKTIEIAPVSKHAIAGSFGVAVAPVVTSITALNGDGKPTVGAGDQLVITLNAPSNG